MNSFPKLTYTWVALLSLVVVGCINFKKIDFKTRDAESTHTASEIYKSNIDKVATIISYRDGIPFSQGSGFFIDKNTLVTNLHCVAGAENIPKFTVEFRLISYEILE